jgi:hypothetical protein
MLAAASIGAIWTGVSPDTGVTAVLERLVQIEPKVLFVDNAVRYNGKVHGSYEKVKGILVGLKGLRACAVFDTVEGSEMKIEGLELANGKAWKYEDFIERQVFLLLLPHVTPLSETDRVKLQRRRSLYTTQVRSTTSIAPALYLIFQWHNWSPEMHRPLCGRHVDPAQERAHPPLRHPSLRPNAVLHYYNMDDVALAHILARSRSYNNSL